MLHVTVDVINNGGRSIDLFDFAFHQCHLQLARGAAVPTLSNGRNSMPLMMWCGSLH